MWKDWLFFSRSQRIGILILVVLILVALAVRIIIPHVYNKPPLSDSFESQAALFLDSLKKTSPQSYKKFYSSKQYPTASVFRSEHEKLPVPVLSHFNPNTADSVQFVRLGMKPWIASNILKYRKKGGQFKKADDIRKIWGLDQTFADRLILYVDIPEEVKKEPVSVPKGIRKTDDMVELNSADTTQLQQIRGIGPSFARRIAGYRKRLGGFVKVEQLKEVWGMTSDLYSSIAPHFTADRKLIQPINVNKASLEKLKSHPYLNFYTAKAIYELRLTKRCLLSIDDIKQAGILSADILEKITPYLVFY